jgi:predicted ATPase/DNA-binding SARP family transcriptional activator
MVRYLFPTVVPTTRIKEPLLRLMARLSLALLGPLQVMLDGAPITTFESDKVRALLAYLAIEADRPHRRDALAGLLWPDRPERAAHLNLNQALANLRGAIGDRTATPPFLSITRETVQFNRASDYELDVEAFSARLAACKEHLHRHVATCKSCIQRLQQAADLYRGSFLAQFFLSDSAAFEEWALLKREWLHRRALHTLARLADYHERRGDCEQAQHYTWQQLELEPWREESHRQLMRVLALSGQRSAALEQYERCRRALADELGVEPAEETTALYENIRDTASAEMSPQRDETQHLQNFPAQPTALIGREAELAELGALLENPACRLITIVGPGGIGKTRLVLAVAAEQAETFTHGAAFVPLQAISAAAFLAPAILSALDIPLQGQRGPGEQLLDHLRGKEQLLVLDNVEQLLAPDQSGDGGAAKLLADLLQRAPGVTLLVTSRERLALQGEWLFDVSGLSYPAGELADDLEGYSAVQLFMQRAGQVRRQFALADGEARAVARICRLVEGLPLAIELAAAALRGRSCGAIAAAIETSLSALETTLRAVPERHRSIWATFEHSGRLLSDEERQVFPRLSVFRGGFTLEAAAALCGELKIENEQLRKDFTGEAIFNSQSPREYPILNLLSALLDKSLLRWDGTARYDMHELVRQYASEKLEEAGETAELRNRHAAYFLALAEQAEPELWGGADQISWNHRLQMEHDNLRAALQWSLAQEDGALGLRLTAALWWFWLTRGYLNEGRQWLTKALATTVPVSSRVRAKALHGSGSIALDQRDFTAATALLEQALTIARELQDRGQISTLLYTLGEAARLQGDLRQATAHFEESVVLGRGLEDKLTKFGVAASLVSLGTIAHAEGDNARAAIVLEESLTFLRELGNAIYIAWCLAVLGRVATDQGDWGLASGRFVESLSLFRELIQRNGIAYVLEGVAGLSAAQGQTYRAACLFGAVEALREAIHTPLSAFDRPEYERKVATVRAQMDEATFTAAWAAGRRMTLEQAIAYALEVGASTVEPLRVASSTQ